MARGKGKRGGCRGGGGVWRPGGPLAPPASQTKARAALPLLCARFARPPPPRGAAAAPAGPWVCGGAGEKRGRAHPRIEGWEKGRIA
ncbi:MAG: hypothetical protein DBY06_02795 [Clostridiales bacterium]|nr:MAG: hypothetical protein DBY06_02795 [Clostridiales bacterium]